MTRPVAWRRQQLLQLARLMQENATLIEDALYADLGKQRFESTAVELGHSMNQCLDAANKVEEWAKPEKPEVDPFRATWDATVYRVPKGTVLIIS